MVIRRALLLVCLLLALSAAYAVPAKPGIILLEQPDGTTIKARQFGDERAAWIEDLNGNKLVQDENGWWIPVHSSVASAKALSPALAQTNPVGGPLFVKGEAPPRPPARAPVTSASVGDLLVIMVEFSDEKSERSPNSTHSGSYEWYSNSSDNLNNTLTHEFNFTNVTNATLTFWTFYEIENNTDYGYVEVSVDNGTSWTQEANYTGLQATWTQKSINLTKYAGNSSVIIRFRYQTNNATAKKGWFIDDINISAVNFFDDVEGGVGNWTAQGWYRTTIFDHPLVHTVTYYYNLLFNSSNSGSMWAYYNETSYGQFNLTGSIVNQQNSGLWYTSVHNLSYYGADAPQNPSNCIIMGYDMGTTDQLNVCSFMLAREALELADPQVNFSAYDKDGDGILEEDELTILIVHAGEGQEASHASNDIWSHRWIIYGAGFNDSGSDKGYNTSDLILDGVRLSYNKSDYDSNKNDPLGYIMLAEDSPVGTFAHEYGHILGLPDLYDTNTSKSRIGKWGLMDSGNWNGVPAGSKPAHLCAWSKYFLGWVNVTVITRGNSLNASIPAIEKNGTIFMLLNSSYASGYVPDSGGSEYFLVENRQKIGFDAALPGDGLLIWHIDDSVGSVASNNVNINNSHKRVDLESADNTDPSSNSGDAGDPWKNSTTGFTQTSSPNSSFYNGSASGVQVTNISVSGDPMYALLSVSNPPVVKVLYPNGGERVNGTITIKANVTDADGQADIQIVKFYYTNGSNWILIGNSTTPVGSVYNVTWNTSSVSDGSSYKIKAVATDNSGLAQFDTSDSNFIVNNINEAPSINLLEPDTGDKWSGTRTIEWSASDPDADTLTIDIYYSDDSGSSWNALSEGEQNDGVYEWDTSLYSDGNNYRIKVIARDPGGLNASDSSGDFTINNTKTKKVSEKGQGLTEEADWHVKVFSSVDAGKSASWTLTGSSELAVTSVNFVTKSKLSNAKLKIRKLSVKPSYIKVIPAGKVYQYFEVQKENIPSNALSSVTIKFKVPQSWFSQNNLDESTLALKRWIGDGWSKLATNKYKTSGGYNYYSASSPGFSVFVITASTKELPVKQAAQQAKTETIAGAAGTNTSEATELKDKIAALLMGEYYGIKNYYWIALTVVLIVIFILLLVAIRAQQKPKKKVRSRARVPRPARWSRWRTFGAGYTGSASYTPFTPRRRSLR